MWKASSINMLMLSLSVIGAVTAYIVGESLLMYAAYLPYWLQCGIYLLFETVVCCAVMAISETIHSGGYILKRRELFRQTCSKAAAFLLPSAFILGAVTQLLYGLAGLSKSVTPDFQGTMIVCDISGSMSDNDPGKNAVEAMLSYVRTVPLNENLGVIIFNDAPSLMRTYAP
jgi:hypothetical protein